MTRKIEHSPAVIRNSANSNAQQAGPLKLYTNFIHINLLAVEQSPQAIPVGLRRGGPNKLTIPARVALCKRSQLRRRFSDKAALGGKFERAFEVSAVQSRQERLRDGYGLRLAVL